MKSSIYCFYMKTKILVYFQICTGGTFNINSLTYVFSPSSLHILNIILNSPSEGAPTASWKKRGYCGYKQWVLAQSLVNTEPFILPTGQYRAFVNLRQVSLFLRNYEVFEPFLCLFSLIWIKIHFPLECLSAYFR